jgi:small GTP-binding protein
MSKNRPSTSIWLIVSMAGLGALLLLVPPLVISQYEQARRLGEVAGTIYLAALVTGAVLLLASGSWVVWRVWQNTREKRRLTTRAAKDPRAMSVAERQREVADNLASVRNFQEDPSIDDELRGELDPLVERVAAKTENQKLEIVAFGTISSGKSSLLNALAGRDVFSSDIKGGTTRERNEIPWPGDNKVVLVDTPGLGEIDGLARQAIAADVAKDADLVLLVVDGPLRDSEFKLVEQLSQMQKRILICLNKEDWYGPSERERLLSQIVEQTREHVPADDVVAIRSRPTLRTRLRVTASGEEVAETAEVSPDIEPLARRMMHIVRRDGRDLLLANLLLQSRGLVEDAKRRVQASLDRRAWQIVDRYTWGAGGAAAVSPFPLVDLAAGCVISSKMVVDLAHVYRQKVDADTAVRLLGQMGKQLIGVLGVSVATPAVTAAVASLIKTVPGVGTIVGGAMQGIVVALITRWIGAVFIEYFKHEMQEPPGGLANLARREWQRLTKVDELRKLVQAAQRHWAQQQEKP